MIRETYKSMVSNFTPHVEEILPWDLIDEIDAGVNLVLLDTRCPHEFDAAHLANSINVPRGILEIAVDYGYEETVPALVNARDSRVVTLCRSGNRSILAAHTLQLMGYNNVASLRTGVRGWNEYEQALYDGRGSEVDLDDAEALLTSKISEEQLGN